MSLNAIKRFAIDNLKKKKIKLSYLIKSPSECALKLNSQRKKITISVEYYYTVSLIKRSSHTVLKWHTTIAQFLYIL